MGFSVILSISPTPFVPPYSYPLPSKHRRFATLAYRIFSHVPAASRLIVSFAPSCSRCLRGSKIRDVTPGAYDSGHYCPSKLTVRYCSPCSTPSIPPDKFLFHTFGLPTFRFRPAASAPNFNEGETLLENYNRAVPVWGLNYARRFIDFP